MFWLSEDDMNTINVVDNIEDQDFYEEAEYGRFWSFDGVSLPIPEEGWDD